jgi:hypothetical protein
MQVYLAHQPIEGGCPNAAVIHLNIPSDLKWLAVRTTGIVRHDREPVKPVMQSAVATIASFTLAAVRGEWYICRVFVVCAVRKREG